MILIRITLFVLTLQLVLAQSASAAQAKQGTKEGDLKSNLSVLNLFEKQPESVNQMYSMAYNVLSEKRDATFSDLERNADFLSVCRKQGVSHLGGPMLGSVSSEGASVWIRTLTPAEVLIKVTIDGVEKTYGPVKSTSESDLTAVVPVTGLKPNTRYPYRVMVDGKPIRIPETAAIITAPEATPSGKVRIAFGSCFHRWGLGNKAQADLIRSRRPAAMLLMGDIAVQDRNNHLGLHRADYLMRDLFPAWQDLVAAVPVYATWDDHDYFANDKAGVPKGYTEKDKEGVCDVFKQAWNNPAYGFGDERRGVFLRTRIGSCDIIMVDNRYFREGKKGSFLGDDQMKWLKEQLLDCKGPFIILSCGSMWSDYVSKGKDSWGKCDPKGREQIFNLIEENKIGGVLLISGDRHGARGFRIPRPSGFEFYEFEAGSLGGRTGPPAKDPKWQTQLYGVSGKYAFGEFSIDATLPDPEVTFRLIGDDGDVLHNLTLKRSQLTPRKK
jgi:alkaline phosphatase D